MKLLNTSIKTPNSKNKGFTLIELLIVVSIIAILSGIVLSAINFKGVKAKVRDNQRINDLKVLQNALESYYADYRRYPVVATDWQAVHDVQFTAALLPYIDEIPEDPSHKEDGSYINYMYGPMESYTSYYLITQMENDSSAAKSPCSDYTAFGSMAPWFARCYIVTSPRLFD